MQFGIFTVGDVTTDPTTGTTPSEHERIKATVAIAQQGRGGRPRRLRDRRAPQPAVRAVVADDDARLHRRPDREADPLHVHDADHHQRPGEDRRGLRDAPAPRRRPRRPDDGPRQHRPGLPVVRQGHPPGHPAGDRELRAAAPAVARGRRRLGGQVPHAAAGLHLDAAPARRRAAVRLARLDPQPRDRRAGRVLRRRLLRQQHLLAHGAHPADGRASTAERFEHYGHGTADQAIVGPRRPGVHAQELAGRGARVPPVLRQRAGLRPRPVAGGVHRADPADRRAARSRSSSGRWPSASTSATTSASCS